MRNILRTFVLFAVMATLSSCSWFETDNAGDLEGLWHVRSVEFKADGTKTDLSSERYYWAFQKKLLQMEDKEGKAATFLWRFQKEENKLTISQPYRYDRENGDEPLESTDLLAPYFIENLEETFTIEHLGSGTMLLSSETVRLSFRKF